MVLRIRPDPNIFSGSDHWFEQTNVDLKVTTIVQKWHRKIYLFKLVLFKMKSFANLFHSFFSSSKSGHKYHKICTYYTVTTCTLRVPDLN